MSSQKVSLEVKDPEILKLYSCIVMLSIVISAKTNFLSRNSIVK